MAQKVDAEIDLLDRLLDDRRRDLRVRRGPPDERQPHQRIDMERTFVDETEIALQLAMIGGEDHIGVGVPAPRLDLRHARWPIASSINSFIT